MESLNVLRTEFVITLNLAFYYYHKVTHLADAMSKICASIGSSHSDTGQQAPESRIDLWTFRDQQNVAQY